MTQAAESSGQRGRALPWHEELAERLAAGRLPAATMITGRCADGIEQLALDVAGRILDRQSSQSAALLDAGTHPDLMVLRRQPNTTGKLRQEIVIDQARQLLEYMQLAPRIARTRLAVIIPACRLNRNAANSLLKVLEEPPPAGRFILAAEQPERLPATVRSRMHIVPAASPSREQALAWLKESHPDITDGEAALAEAAGAPLDAPECRQQARLRETFVRMATGRVDLASGCRELAGLPIETWMAWAQYWVSDLIAASLGIQPRMFPAAEEAAGGSIMRMLDAGRELQEMRRLAQHPVNARQLLERTAIRLQQLRRPA